MPPKAEVVKRQSVSKKASEKGQTITQTVIIQAPKEVPKKKRRTRRKRAVKRNIESSPLEQFRSLIAPTILLPQAQSQPPPPPSMGDEYRKLLDTLISINATQNIKAEQQEQRPFTLPDTVSQYAQSAQDIFGTIGDVAQTVESGAEAIQDITQAVSSVQDTKNIVSDFLAPVPSVQEIELETKNLKKYIKTERQKITREKNKKDKTEASGSAPSVFYDDTPMIQTPANQQQEIKRPVERPKKQTGKQMTEQLLELTKRFK